MTKRTWIRTIVLTALVLSLAAVNVPQLLGKAYAAVPHLEQIRVALFINTGKVDRGTVPTVSLSAEGGLHVGMHEPNVAKDGINSSKKIRVSIDQYTISIAEYSEYAQASAALNQLSSAGYTGYLFAVDLQGKVKYLLRIGSYSSLPEADAVLRKLNNDDKVLPLFPESSFALKGPLYWNAGSYTSKAEAMEQMSLLTASGVTAYLAYQSAADGSIIYSVWLGEGANETQWELAKTQTANLVPGIQLRPVDMSSPYVLLRNDVSQTAAGQDAVPHYFFNPSVGGIWVGAVSPSEGIHVAEKADKAYRGNFELRQMNHQMAVINELPLDTYLYSVVGAEMPQSFPLEAFKAQAVAARTFALKMGMKYQIAHISDSSFDQVYYGIDSESPVAIQAVDETTSEVLVYNGELITPFYSSNAGGVTGDPVEVWGGEPFAYLQSVGSPDDIAEMDEPIWYHIVLSDGLTGYVRSDLMVDTGVKTINGLPYYRANGTGINVRSAPFVNDITNPAIAQMNDGEHAIVFEQRKESNSFSWISRPYLGSELLASINSYLDQPIGSLQSLEITDRGPSGRVSTAKANGKLIQVSSSDDYRTVFPNILSSRFEIEETARYTVLGANEAVNHPESVAPLYLASGTETARVGTSWFMTDGSQLRVATADPEFIFVGQGSGHGVGMSQWGTKGFAELGYDYQKILQYFYNGVTLVKE